MADLKFSESTKAGIIILSVDGKLDAATAEQLQTKLDELATKSSKLIANISKVNYISSAGIGVFIKTQKGLMAKKGKLVLSEMTGDVKKVFALHGFDKAFTITVNNADAEKAF